MTRARLLAAGAVAAFLAAFFALGAVSRSTPAATGVTAAAQLPYAPWYWTMAVSPTDAKVLVLATSNGLLRSADGAKTWQATGPKNVNMTSVVTAGGSLYAGGVPGPNPVARKGKGRTAPDGPGVLAASADGGRTWRVLHPAGLPNHTIQALAADPADAGTLYALLNDGGLYRSTDGAKSFTRVTAKLGVAPWALAVAQGGRFVAGDMDSGGFQSANGKTWLRSPFTDSNGGRMVMEYAVQPSDTSRIVMTSVGIELSSDAGKTWKPALRSKVMFGPVAWAPSEPDLVYAIGFDRSFWRSSDGGKTWLKVSA